MNQIDKPDSFDTDALRKKISEIRTIAPGEKREDEPKRELNPLARKIAAQFRTDTYSPNMIIGLMRLFEFTALFAIGYAIHMLYVAPPSDEMLGYCGLIAGGAALTVMFLQLCDGYQVPTLRFGWTGHPPADRLLDAGICLHDAGAVPAQDRRDVFAPVLRRLVCARRRLFDRRARLHRLFHSPLGPQRHHGAPRRHRRRRSAGQGPDPFARTADRQRYPHLRYFRRPRRAPLARHHRRLSEARHRGRTRRFRPPHPHRHPDHRPAALGGKAYSRIAAQAVDPAGRHPSCRPCQQSAVPAAQLFACRPGADARYFRQADRRLGFGRQAHLRRVLQHRRPGRALAGLHRRRHRRQGELAWPDHLQAEAPRLQQRDDRRLQVSARCIRI